MITISTEGDIGIFSYFLDRFFGFCAKKIRFFGFGVPCGLQIFHFLASGFRLFRRKKIAVFRFYYPMWFLGFPILSVSEVFGFGRIFWRFCGFE